MRGTWRKAGGGGKRLCWHTLLLVLLTLPLITDELSFGATDDDNSDDGKDVSDLASSKSAAAGAGRGISGRFTVKPRPTPKKFQFHKIERVYVDDFVKDESDGAGDDEADYDDADEDNDGDTDNADGKSEVVYEAEDARNSRFNKDKEFEFEQVHRAKMDRGQNKKIKATVKTKSPKSAQEDGWLPKFMLNLFESVNNTHNDGKLKPAQGEKEAKKRSNNIIYWIQWLGERIGRIPAPKDEKPVVSASDNWLAYLNRWPFNSIFPMGETAESIRVPLCDRLGDDGTSENSTNGVQPMSQNHFESLLRTLPGFVTNASHASDAKCRQQLQIFHRQLRAHKLWALQMLDSTGKITSGILRGNINQFGDFDQCTQVRTLVKVTPERPVRIRGKYCLAQIETRTDVDSLKVPLHLAHGRGLWNSHLGNPNHFAPRYTVANWGICIPHTCSSSVVHEMLQTNLRPYNSSGVEFYIDVRDENCMVQHSRRFLRILKKHAKFGASLIYMGALLLLGLMALLWEHWIWLSKQVHKMFKRNSNAAEPSKIKISERNETTKMQMENEAKEIEEEEAAANSTLNAMKLVESGESTEATTHRMYVNNSLKSLLLESLCAFSPQRSVQTLISLESPDVQFPILHVVKLCATLMLYVCLKYLMLGHLPLSNRHALVHALNKPWSVLLRTPLIYSDTLLLLSGFLVACQLSEEMEQKHYIQVLKRITAKATSYLPAMYVTLGFQTWILPHLGTGPLWNELINENARICEKQMWRNVFSVQNAINVEETCSPLTLQLALNIQLYLLGPLIVWLYYTDADAAFFTFGALQAMSVAMRFARTNLEHLSITLFHGMNVSKFYRTANMIYASPISRATPYLLGIAAGLVYRSGHVVREITGHYLPLCWTLALISIIWCFWSPASSMRSDFIYTPNEAAAYAAWSPLVLGIALCWCILMFPRGEDSVLRFLTNSRPVLVLSRLTYPIQLAMYVIVLWNTASVKEIIKFQLNDLLNFQEIGSIICLAVVLAIAVDVPAQRVRCLFINYIFIERTQSDVEHATVSGSKPSEVEQSEEASDTPEPTETIWSSDREEEEQKYIARRRSSVIDINLAHVANAETEAATKSREKIEDEQELEESEEQETEIEEVAEVKKRPCTSSPTPAEVKKEATPSPTPKAAVPFTRRRRPVSDD